MSLAQPNGLESSTVARRSRLASSADSTLVTWEEKSSFKFLETATNCRFRNAGCLCRRRDTTPAKGPCFDCRLPNTTPSARPENRTVRSIF